MKLKKKNTENRKIFLAEGTMTNMQNKQNVVYSRKYEKFHLPWALHIGIGSTGTWSLRRSLDITYLDLLNITRGWICKPILRSIPKTAIVIWSVCSLESPGSYRNCQGLGFTLKQLNPNLRMRSPRSHDSYVWPGTRTTDTVPPTRVRC